MRLTERMIEEQRQNILAEKQVVDRNREAEDETGYMYMPPRSVSFINAERSVFESQMETGINTEQSVFDKTALFRTGTNGAAEE